MTERKLPPALEDKVRADEWVGDHVTASDLLDFFCGTEDEPDLVTRVYNRVSGPLAPGLKVTIADVFAALQAELGMEEP